MPRPKRSDIFSNEREEICKKLIDIVGTEFLLCDLDNDTTKQDAIIALKDDIKKVFAVSRIMSFSPYTMNDVKREYFNIVKAILKQEGYRFESHPYIKNSGNGILTKTTRYIIIKD